MQPVFSLQRGILLMRQPQGIDRQPDERRDGRRVQISSDAWQHVQSMVGSMHARTLRLLCRTGLTHHNENLFHVLVTCAREMSVTSGETRRQAHARGLHLAANIVRQQDRERRALRYSTNRPSAIASLQIMNLSNTLLRLRRQTLPTDFSGALQARGYRYRTFCEALSLLIERCEPQAGDFVLLLAQKVSRIAHERPRSAEAKAVPSEPPTPLSHGECAICCERRPRWALQACGHAAACRTCLHRHAFERLRSGIAPACPLCRAPLTPGEVLLFIAPHNRLHPHPSSDVGATPAQSDVLF